MVYAISAYYLCLANSQRGQLRLNYHHLADETAPREMGYLALLCISVTHHTVHPFYRTSFPLYVRSYLNIFNAHPHLISLSSKHIHLAFVPLPGSFISSPSFTHHALEGFISSQDNCWYYLEWRYVRISIHVNFTVAVLNLRLMAEVNGISWIPLQQINIRVRLCPCALLICPCEMYVLRLSQGGSLGKGGIPSSSSNRSTNIADVRSDAFSFFFRTSFAPWKIQTKNSKIRDGGGFCQIFLFKYKFRIFRPSNFSATS